MNIVLVRHGSTEPNERGVLLGRGADPGLTERGRAQAQALGVVLGDEAVTEVVSSPLARCRETAALIARTVGPDLPVAVEDRLAEIDYGEWEGQRLADLPADSAHTWRSDPDFRPPSGESLAEVAARVGSWCAERVGDGTVVAVTHVSPIKAAVAWALGAPPTLAWRLYVAVASVTAIAVGPHGAVLTRFNESAHLRGN